MAVVFRFSTEKYINEKKIQVIKAVNESVDYLYKEIRKNSPTDTKKYINNHKKNKAVDFSWTIVGGVENSTSYAIFLEMGVEQKTYNYHKGPPRDKSTEFYTGVWVKTFARSLDNSREFFLESLRKNTRW